MKQDVRFLIENKSKFLLVSLLSLVHTTLHHTITPSHVRTTLRHTHPPSHVHTTLHHTITSSHVHTTLRHTHPPSHMHTHTLSHHYSLTHSNPHSLTHTHLTPSHVHTSLPHTCTPTLLIQPSLPHTHTPSHHHCPTSPLPLPPSLQVHSSSGHKQALKEVLSDPAVNIRLADTKVKPVHNCTLCYAPFPAIYHAPSMPRPLQAAGEVRALEAFYTMLQNEPDRAFYG